MTDTIKRFFTDIDKLKEGHINFRQYQHLLLRCGFNIAEPIAADFFKATCGSDSSYVTLSTFADWYGALVEYQQPRTVTPPRQQTSSLPPRMSTCKNQLQDKLFMQRI